MSGHPIDHSSGHDRGSGPLPIDPMPHAVFGLRRACALVGIVCLVLLLFPMIFGDVERYKAFRGLLFAFHFWMGPTLGAMAFVAISHMTGGGWGVVYRRFAEAAFTTLPYMLLVCLLLVPGYYRIFPWTHISTFRLSEPEVYGVMKSRLPWYSYNWFLVRQLVYFAIWGLLAYKLRTKSLQLDHQADPVLRRRLRKWSAATVVLFFVTITSYAMDYIMSREPVWYSSILGFVSAIEFGASGVALCTLTLCYFAKRPPFRDVLSPQHLNDLGNLLLALVILWMYTSFAQFLIQWNGNLTGDIGYYVQRGMGKVPNPWRFVALTLFLGHFLLPFFLLLMKGLKRKARTLGAICVWLLIMRVVESLWVIAPSGAHRTADPGGVYLTDLIAFLGVGGIWMFLYLYNLGTEPLLPQNATDQPEPISHATHATAAHAV